MFTQAEANALVASLRLAQAWLDPGMAGDAEAALGKIFSVLSVSSRAAAESLPLYAPVMGVDVATQGKLQLLREAAQARRKLRVDYVDAAGKNSQRVLWPLGCFYWGSVWTLAAWCEARQDFRGFRVDRMVQLELLDAPMGREPGRTLADFLRAARKN